jgi:ubiquitin conjugation factor E4 B
MQLERFKKETERRQAEVYAMETQLLDPKLLGQQIHFYNFAMAWLVRLVDPKHEHPKRPITLPLPEETPPAFAMLPEYLLEDIAEFFVLVSRSACRFPFV